MLVNRFDAIDISAKSATKFQKTPEGYLKGRAVVARTGIYKYRKQDGTLYNEYRDENEVFRSDAVESLKLKPISILHPNQMINADNVQLFQVGNLGSDWSKIKRDSENDLVIDLIIQDSDAVAKIEAGELRELSLGYQCDIEDAPVGAKFDGKEYQTVQKNILINHCALVEKGRAQNAIIKMDSVDAIMVSDAVPVAAQDIENTTEVHMANLKTIKLDGVDREAEGEVLEALHSSIQKADGLQASLDALTSDKTKVEAERDTLKDRVDALEKELVEAKNVKLDEVAVKAAVERRVKILDAARIAEVEVKEDMDELAIQKAVILKVFPSAKLDGKDAVYIDARFDGAIESLEARNDAANRMVVAPEATKKDETVDANKARDAYLKRLVTKE
jgi:hypothetical protein